MIKLNASDIQKFITEHAPKDVSEACDVLALFLKGIEGGHDYFTGLDKKYRYFVNITGTANVLVREGENSEVIGSIAVDYFKSYKEMVNTLIGLEYISRWDSVHKDTNTTYVIVRLEKKYIGMRFPNNLFEIIDDFEDNRNYIEEVLGEVI